MKRTISTILLSAFLLSPVSLFGDDHNQHVWNDQESTYWHQYLREHHKKDKDWQKASERDKRNYWKWRDAHRDDHHDEEHHDQH